ncbi:MAG: DNA repair protein RecO [Parachlamydiaceae bacterium]|nr:DNA repair protein RecO [Parachlamydiaceae bacterium]
MVYQKNEGIILHTIKYGEYDQILSVFTREEGLIKMIFRGAYAKKRAIGASTAPFTQSEFVYERRQSSLFVCHETALINAHLSLRKSLACIDAAYLLAKILLTSQAEQKSSPLLYDLFVCYLTRIPLSLSPAALVASFQMKFLRHEGLFGFTPHCSLCKADLKDHFIARGESFCEGDRPAEAMKLTPFEAESLFILAFSKSYELIEQSALGGDLKAKIEWIFDTQVSM